MTSNDKDAIKESQFFDRDDNVSLAYHYTPGHSPCVVFLCGFKSDMNGSKAVALEAHCQAKGQAFLRFDYQGHGRSSGAFDQGTIGVWANDTISMLDHISSVYLEQSFVLVGSSMGGWIMLLSALARKDRIDGLVGIAAAPDFTERLITNVLNDDQLINLNEKGRIEFPNEYGDYDDEPYIITKKLIDDGKNQLLLGKAIDLNVPVRLIHGMEDKDVPWSTSLDITKQLVGHDVEVQLVKDGGHRLSDPQDLERLYTTVDGLLDSISLLENQRNDLGEDLEFKHIGNAGEFVDSERRTGMERRMVHRLLVHWRNAHRKERRVLSYQDILDWGLDDISSQIFMVNIPIDQGEPILENIGLSFLKDLPSELSMRINGQPISSAPKNSLINMASRYYEKVLAKKVPYIIGGDFINQNGDLVLYRSIITPLESGDERINLLLCAANYKIEKGGA
jgi:pimeloyl-ACP methyl ester carboxylesterase